jgi:cellulose synthase/poly-beta-1,6-N-acetylglucosamine synthase-like glycosyltransferase
MKIGHCHTAFAYTKGPDSLKKLFCQRLRWCYGGINNMKDYRHMIFNKKYGHFGFLTLPMNIFNYILVIFVFSLGLYRIGLFINQKILEFSVFGWKNIVAFDWDYFFISFKPTFFLAIITGIFILSAIYFGKKISLIKKWEITHILYFIIIYGLLAPVWIIKSLYKTLFFKNLSWR